METNKVKRGRGRQLVVKHKLLTLMKGETSKGFFLDVAMTGKGELYVFVQSSSPSGRTTYRVNLTEVKDIRND